jgi:hypothetical protein
MLNRRLAMLAAAAGLAVGSAAAQTPAPTPVRAPPPPFSEADRAAAEAVVHRYFAAFSVKEFATFREVFTVPFVVGGREMSVETALEQTAGRYERLRNSFDAQDYSASKATEVRIIPLHAASALAYIHWQRFRKSGAVLNEGAEVMILAKVGGAWKITGNLGADLRSFPR